jgi:hypothetical protein
VDAGDLAEFAGLDHLHDTPVIGEVVVDVIPHLRNPAVVQRRVGDGAALSHTVAERFLDKHIFSRLEGCHRRDGVPVVGCDHRDGVDLFVLEELSEVAESLGLIALGLFDDADGAVEVALIDIADGGDSNIILLQKLVQAVESLAAHPNTTRDNLIIRTSGGNCRPAERCERRCATQRSEK